MPRRSKPVVLLILDGWGIAPYGDSNAIGKADLPVFNKLITNYPTMPLRASGDEVGLSWGEMGNSEVGHLTIGAGRVFYQSLPRINKLIENKKFFENEVFTEAMANVKKNKSALHLIGMVSPGRVHSMDSHLYALLELAKKEKIKNVFIHAFLDGRDTVYNSGIDFITSLEKKIKELKIGKIATLSGRYYAMDRDNRWDRTEKTYNAIAHGESSEYFKKPIDAIKSSYAKEVFDEQFVPVVIGEKNKPIAKVESNDSVICFNFRPDRMRQIVKAFVLPDFNNFERKKVENIYFATMTEYEKDLPVHVALPPEIVSKPIAKVISDNNLKQLHIAETEKYAHVTFFLNGRHEELLPGEDRIIISSPQVSSYDLKPEMSAYEITKKVIKEIDDDKYDFVVMNFANPDMVAHTGNFDATVKAVEVVDECIGKIIDAVSLKDGVVVITADHGNAEELKNLQTGDIDKEHSTNPVPIILVGKNFSGQLSQSGEIPGGDLSLVPPCGMLADVAPTVLKIMGLPQPEEMTGQTLI